MINTRQDILIAVVDDDFRTCELIKKMLEASPRYRVAVAYDGKDGLAMIAKMKPDIAVLDIDMPRMNGLKLLEKIKSRRGTQHIPVIMLTGSDTKENAEKSSHWYADAYLTKPCSTERLTAALDRSLSCHAPARQRCGKQRKGEHRMNECEMLSRCSFFDDQMSRTPCHAVLFKSLYCNGNNKICARYLLLKVLGAAAIPADLFPNHEQRGRAIIKQASSNQSPRTSTMPRPRSYSRIMGGYTEEQASV